MPNSRLLALAVAGSTALAALILVPSPANAAMTLTRVTAVSASNATDAKSATAICPIGTRVIGGGADINGAGNDVHLTGLQPNGLANTYIAFAREHYATDVPWTLTAFAVCAPAPPGLYYAYEVVESTAWESSLSDYAFCPAGTKVLGSGARVTAADTSKLFLTYAKPTGTGNGSEAGAVEKAGGYDFDWQLHTWSVCAVAPTGWDAVTANSPNGGLSTSFTCPGTKKLTGAGVLISLSLGRIFLVDSQVTASFATPTNPRGTVVAANVIDSGYSHEWFIRAHAICVS